MKPRRLHSDTIFSIKGVSFGSAMRRAVFLKHRLMSREARNGSGTVRWGKAHEPPLRPPRPRSRLADSLDVRCFPSVQWGRGLRGSRFMIREQFPKASARRCGTGRIRGIIPEKSLLFPSLGDTPRVVNPETEPETNSRSQPLEGAT